MKTISITTLCFILCCTTWLACNKDDDNSAKTQYGCPATSPLNYRQGSSVVMLPTAFTPNGDGMNDVFRVITKDIDTAGFFMSITKGGDAVSYASNTLSEGWAGKNALGTYEVNIKFRTLSGIEKDTCNTIVVLQKDASTNCINTNGRTYVFEDELDPVAGMNRNTNEHICP